MVEHTHTSPTAKVGTGLLSFDHVMGTGFGPGSCGIKLYHLKKKKFYLAQQINITKQSIINLDDNCQISGGYCTKF